MPKKLRGAAWATPGAESRTVAATQATAAAAKARAIDAFLILISSAQT
jgi:hypothetical protein